MILIVLIILGIKRYLEWPVRFNSELDKFICDVLTDEQLEYLKVEMLYKGGNSKPEFYSDILKKEWFNINDISAINYLLMDSYNFYIDIFAYNYKLNNLEEENRQNIYNSLTLIENRLLKEYDDNASFRIYFNNQYKVEYENGIKYNHIVVFFGKEVYNNFTFKRRFVYGII